MAVILAFDTSNYTTSAAFFDTLSGRGANVSRPLPVAAGSLGLRQNDAVFAHIKALPEVMEILASRGGYSPPDAFAASVAPRSAPGSYMPCFLVGENTARTEALSRRARFFTCSHQEGHIAAAAYSSGEPEILRTPFLAWHLSGGTTELLYVAPERGHVVHARRIGGTTDISAGQLIDRTGAALSLPFPSGAALSLVAEEDASDINYRVRLKDCDFSLSGMENRVKGMIADGCAPSDAANFVINTLIGAITRATGQALLKYPGLRVLCSGGVASNARLRGVMRREFDAMFARPEYSTDNAMGVALIAAILNEGEIPEWTPV